MNWTLAVLGAGAKARWRRAKALKGDGGVDARRDRRRTHQVGASGGWTDGASTAGYPAQKKDVGFPYRLHGATQN